MCQLPAPQTTSTAPGSTASSLALHQEPLISSLISAQAVKDHLLSRLNARTPHTHASGLTPGWLPQHNMLPGRSCHTADYPQVWWGFTQLSVHTLWFETLREEARKNAVFIWIFRETLRRFRWGNPLGTGRGMRLNSCTLFYSILGYFSGTQITWTWLLDPKSTLPPSTRNDRSHSLPAELPVPHLIETRFPWNCSTTTNLLPLVRTDVTTA